MEGTVNKIAFLNPINPETDIIIPYTIPREAFIGVGFNTLDYVAIGTRSPPAFDIRAFPSNSQIWNKKFNTQEAPINMDISSDDKHIIITDGSKVTIY